MSTTGLPSSLRTGETRVVTVRMRNTGGTTWTGSKGYQLGSQSPVNNTTWGLNRKAVSGSVAPNGVHSFKLTIKAPSKPGNYSFRWRMLRESGGDPTNPNPPPAITSSGSPWFGAQTPSRTITVTSAPTDGASFVSYAGLPSSMTAGSTKTVTVTMKNTGGTTWTAGGGYKLGSQGAPNNTTWGLKEKTVAGSVAPNRSHVFTLTIKAPSTAGSYSFSWRMRRNGTWFGDASTSRAITVTSPPADKARFVSYSGLPSSMTAGSTKTVTVTMKNTGTTTWTAGAGYKLGSHTSAATPPWGLRQVALSGSVAPNESHAFTFTMTAPSTAGSYGFGWRMLRGTKWFGWASPSETITVTLPPRDDASFDSVSGVPGTMTAGGVEQVSVTVRNMGNTTWSRSGGYALNEVSGDWGIAAVELPAGVTVAPNAVHTFQVDMTAPESPGPYELELRMRKGSNGWFGARSTHGVEVALPEGVLVDRVVDAAPLDPCHRFTLASAQRVKFSVTERTGLPLTGGPRTYSWKRDLEAGEHKVCVRRNAGSSLRVPADRYDVKVEAIGATEQEASSADDADPDSVTAEVEGPELCAIDGGEQPDCDTPPPIIDEVITVIEDHYEFTYDVNMPWPRDFWDDYPWDWEPIYEYLAENFKREYYVDADEDGLIDDLADVADFTDCRSRNFKENELFGAAWGGENTKRNHSGIDMNTKRTPVWFRSPETGMLTYHDQWARTVDPETGEEVLDVGNHYGCGHWAKITVEDGKYWQICHLDVRTDFPEGPVYAGSFIGFYGKTGTVFGAHLHLAFRNADGTPLNPLSRWGGKDEMEGTGDWTFGPEPNSCEE